VFFLAGSGLAIAIAIASLIGYGIIEEIKTYGNILIPVPGTDGKIFTGTGHTGGTA
jgi:hypothetical protein